jgi:hypothetical protein
MSLTERIKVEHLVRCACGVLAMDRASLPEPCQEHGELAVVEYVRADTYREAVEALRQISALLDVVEVDPDDGWDYGAGVMRAIAADALNHLGGQ